MAGVADKRNPLAVVEISYSGNSDADKSSTIRTNFEWQPIRTFSIPNRWTLFVCEGILHFAFDMSMARRGGISSFVCL